jgi:hypothetical protein
LDKCRQDFDKPAPQDVVAVTKTAAGKAGPANMPDWKNQSMERFHKRDALAQGDRMDAPPMYRPKRWKRLLVVGRHKKPGEMTLAEKMYIFDAHQRCRSPFAGPMTRLVQHSYDKAVANFCASTDTDYFDVVTHATDTEASLHDAQRLALSSALTSWLALATEEASAVTVSGDFPIKFKDVVRNVLRGQNRNVQSRLAFLSSIKPLSALA